MTLNPSPTYAPATSIPELVVHVERTGFAYGTVGARNVSTAELAASFGLVVDIPRFLPGANIETVQTLLPCRNKDSSPYRYSGRFGLQEFPLHTELAHWAVPPRYLSLRAVCGSEVQTLVLTWDFVCSQMPSKFLRRALLRPRRLPPTGAFTALRVVTSVDSLDVFRWDTVFLAPLNPSACVLGEFLKSATRKSTTVTLRDADDVLLIDNWRTLHGRSAVDMRSLGRRIERVYLEELHSCHK